MKTKFEMDGSSVRITYPDGVMRTYRVVGRESGYVYDVTDRPGTLGQQVMDPRRPDGTTLFCRIDNLIGTLRRCLRAARDQARRSDYGDADRVML